MCRSNISRHHNIVQRVKYRLLLNKIEKAYSLEHTDIPKAFFTPHHLGHCLTNAIRGHCCVLGHSCTVIPGHCCATVFFNNDLKTSLFFFYEKRDRQTDMEEPIECSSLKLEREEHLKRNWSVQ
jgi:hypothetical protein